MNIWISSCALAPVRVEGKWHRSRSADSSRQSQSSSRTKGWKSAATSTICPCQRGEAEARHAHRESPLKAAAVHDWLLQELSREVVLSGDRGGQSLSIRPLSCGVAAEASRVVLLSDWLVFHHNCLLMLLVEANRAQTWQPKCSIPQCIEHLHQASTVQYSIEQIVFALCLLT